MYFMPTEQAYLKNLLPYNSINRTIRVSNDYNSTLLPSTNEFDILALTMLVPNEHIRNTLKHRPSERGMIYVKTSMMRSTPKQYFSLAAVTDNYKYIQIVNTKGCDNETITEYITTLTDRNYKELKCAALLQYATMFIKILHNEDLTHFVVFSSRVNEQLAQNICAVYIKEYFESHTNIKNTGDYQDFSAIIDDIWNNRVEKTDAILEWMYPNYLEKIKEEKEIRRKNAITTCLADLNRARSRTIEQELESTNEDIRSYENALSTLYAKQYECQLKATAIQLGLERSEAVDNIRQMIEKENSNIIDISARSNTVIQFYVQSVLKFWEQDEYERLSENYLRNKSNLQKLFMDKIFKTKEIKVHMAECVEYDLRQNSIHYYNEHETMYSTKAYYEETSGIPNPHHFYYNCWGDNKNPIINAFVHGNYDIAINQIIAAVSSINIVDNAVFNRFVNALTGERDDAGPLYTRTKNKKAYEYKGVRYTRSQLYDVLKKELAEQRATAMSEDENNTAF